MKNNIKYVADEYKSFVGYMKDKYFDYTKTQDDKEAEADLKKFFKVLRKIKRYKNELVEKDTDIAHPCHSNRNTPREYYSFLMRIIPVKENLNEGCTAMACHEIVDYIVLEGIGQSRKFNCLYFTLETYLKEKK